MTLSGVEFSIGAHVGFLAPWGDILGSNPYSSDFGTAPVHSAAAM